MELNSIPKNFNYIEYKNLYEDLKDFNELECKEHYLLHGIYENICDFYSKNGFEKHGSQMKLYLN